MGDEKEKTDTKGDTGDRVKQAIEEIGKELAELEGMGVDVGDAQAFVKHATLALSGENLKKAVLLTVQAKKFMANAKNPHYLTCRMNSEGGPCHLDMRVFIEYVGIYEQIY